MGSTLLISNEKKAYTLSDRSTWIAFNNREDLKIVCEDFPPLFNQYGIILVKSSLNKNLSNSIEELIFSKAALTGFLNLFLKNVMDKFEN